MMASAVTNIRVGQPTMTIIQPTNPTDMDHVRVDDLYVYTLWYCRFVFDCEIRLVQQIVCWYCFWYYSDKCT